MRKVCKLLVSAVAQIATRNPPVIHVPGPQPLALPGPALPAAPEDDEDEDFGTLVFLAYSNLRDDWQAAHPKPDEWDEPAAYAAHAAAAEQRDQSLRREAERCVRQRLRQLGPGRKGVILYRGRWTIVHSETARRVQEWSDFVRRQRAAGQPTAQPPADVRPWVDLPVG